MTLQASNSSITFNFIVTITKICHSAIFEKKWKRQATGHDADHIILKCVPTGQGKYGP